MPNTKWRQSLPVRLFGLTALKTLLKVMAISFCISAVFSSLIHPQIDGRRLSTYEIEVVRGLRKFEADMAAVRMRDAHTRAKALHEIRTQPPPQRGETEAEYRKRVFK